MTERNEEDVEIEKLPADKGRPDEDAAPDLLGEKRAWERISRQIAFGEGL